MHDHHSLAVIQMATIIKSESLLEKLTLRPLSGVSPLSGEIESTDNSQVQRRLFQLLSIIEPMLLNDNNVEKVISNSFIETLIDMLIFQSQNLINIQRNMQRDSNEVLNAPQYLKVLIRCLTSMLRN